MTHAMIRIKDFGVHGALGLDVVKHAMAGKDSEPELVTEVKSVLGMNIKKARVTKILALGYLMSDVSVHKAK